MNNRDDLKTQALQQLERIRRAWNPAKATLDPEYQKVSREVSEWFWALPTEHDGLLIELLEDLYQRMALAPIEEIISGTLIGALMNHKAVQAVPLFCRLFADPAMRGYREDLAEDLGRLGDRQAVPFLIAALADSESQVRAKAAYSLGQLGDRRAIDPLIQLLQQPDDSGSVIPAAREALVRLKGTH